MLMSSTVNMLWPNYNSAWDETKTHFNISRTRLRSVQGREGKVGGIKYCSVRKKLEKYVMFS